MTKTVSLISYSDAHDYIYDNRIEKCIASFTSFDKHDVLQLESKKDPNLKYLCRGPKDSKAELAIIKSYLDEYNRSDKDMGRPLTINMHLAA